MKPSVPARFVGTFHKSGTVLFLTILRRAHSSQLLKLWRRDTVDEPGDWDIGFVQHASMLYPLLEGASRDNIRCVICIRDPRDIIVSGAYYHQTSEEKWLHIARPHLGGLTYQQKINSLPDMQARFQFEMTHAGKRTIERISSIPKNTDAIYLTRLEKLVSKERGEEYRRLFQFLGFEGETLSGLLEIAEQNSIGSSETAPSPGKHKHIRSGKPQQYVSEFSAETLAMFNELYGNIAVELGYPA